MVSHTRLRTAIFRAGLSVGFALGVAVAYLAADSLRPGGLVVVTAVAVYQCWRLYSFRGAPDAS